MGGRAVTYIAHDLELNSARIYNYDYIFNLPHDQFHIYYTGDMQSSPLGYNRYYIYIIHTVIISFYRNNPPGPDPIYTIYK